MFFAKNKKFSQEIAHRTAFVPNRLYDSLLGCRSIVCNRTASCTPAGGRHTCRPYKTGGNYQSSALGESRKSIKPR
jgi:hypothetical protein